jgi:hypothetical protein
MHLRFFLAVAFVFGLALQANAVIVGSGEGFGYRSFLGDALCRQIVAHLSSDDDDPASPAEDHDCRACPICRITSPAFELLPDKQIVVESDRRSPETFVRRGARDLPPYDARTASCQARAPPLIS